MNIDQIQWVTTKCNDLLAIANGKYPLDEETAEKVKLHGEYLVKLSKYNPEAKKSILNTIICIDNMDRAYRNYRKEMDKIL